MKIIKTKNDLPNWFLDKKYPKNLTAIDWYFEIRKVVYLNHLLEDKIQDKEFLLSMLSADAKKIPLIQPDNVQPIQPLTVLESLYISNAITVDGIDLINSDLKKLLLMWKEEIKKEDAVPYSWEYERELEEFMKNIFQKDIVFEDVLKFSELGNPFLSFGRPLNGTPVVIDTQFDDQTIINSVKKWLEEQRKINKEKAKRPFNQNDFDDWTLFKIREIAELDVWAKIENIKIQDKVLASALWSNSDGDVSPIDILRTTSRKKIKEIYNFQTAVRLHGQLIIQEGENFLHK